MLHFCICTLDHTNSNELDAKREEKEASHASDVLKFEKGAENEANPWKRKETAAALKTEAPEQKLGILSHKKYVCIHEICFRIVT